MEDVRLGREKYSRVNLVSVAAATTNQVVLTRDPKRTAFLVTVTDGSVVWISDKPMAATASGLRVAPANAHLAHFSIEEHGSFVTGEVHCWSDAGATVAILETSLGKD